MTAPAARLDRMEAAAAAAHAVLRRVVATLHPRADFHSIGFGVAALEDDLRAALAQLERQEAPQPAAETPESAP